MHRRLLQNWAARREGLDHVIVLYTLPRRVLEHKPGLARRENPHFPCIPVRSAETMLRLALFHCCLELPHHVQMIDYQI